MYLFDSRRNKPHHGSQRPVTRVILLTNYPKSCLLGGRAMQPNIGKLMLFINSISAKTKVYGGLPFQITLSLYLCGNERKICKEKRPSLDGPTLLNLFKTAQQPYLLSISFAEFISIFLGLSASGISRCKSIFNRPCSNEAPNTFT